MIQLVNQNGKIQYNICEYVIDTYDDLQFVPIHNMGSKVFIIDTGDTYILSGD